MDINEIIKKIEFDKLFCLKVYDITPKQILTKTISFDNFRYQMLYCDKELHIKLKVDYKDNKFAGYQETLPQWYLNAFRLTLYSFPQILNDSSELCHIACVQLGEFNFKFLDNIVTMRQNVLKWEEYLKGINEKANKYLAD